MLVVKEPKKSGKKYCVVVRIGDPELSLHRNWLAGDIPRTWDLFASYYDIMDGSFVTDFDAIVYQPGHKWPTIHQLYNAGWFCNYDYVWFVDYDIDTDCNAINNLFALCDILKLELAQPSLTANSYFSHEITKTVPNSFLRYTKFVEMMMPVFSKASICKCADQMQWCKIGWGFDHVWPKLIGYPERGIAIIDSIAMTHTQPIAGNYSVQDALEEKKFWFEKYGLEEDWTVLHSLTF